MTPKQQWEKKVRRILLDPDGRAALKTFGIDVEMVKEEEKEKPIVAVLCPTYRAPEPQMKDALSEMVKYTGGHATVYAGPPIQASVVHWSRNRLITEQLLSGKPWTHILFIDDDIVVEKDHLLKLLSHKKDIVAGLCTRRQDPPIPNMLILNENSQKYERIWEWPENALIGDKHNIGIGTGLMLISKNALEQTAQAYFDCLWEQQHYGLAGEKLEQIKKIRLQAFDAEKICYWFRFLGTGVEMGEDISFCYVATQYCKIPVYVDTSVQPGHLGSYPFSIRDFMPYRNECVARAKVQGKYRSQEQNLGVVEKKPYSVVIPSANPDNLLACVNAIIENEPDLDPKRIIVVDDGARQGKAANLPVTWVEGKKPFIFARNANLGITVADSDVILLNDDARLLTKYGFTELVKQNTGICSAAIEGFVGNEEQKQVGKGVRKVTGKALCFIAVHIPKRVQEALGPLDERFTAYGFDDNDYCKRASEAGIGQYVFDGCVVEHESLTPTFRSDPNWVEKCYEAQEIFRQKYA